MSNIIQPNKNLLIDGNRNPFMEVERIFNCIRYKYLSAILKGRRDPQDYISSEFNYLFRVLSGFPLRNDPKGIKARRLAFAEGFDVNALPLIDLTREKYELRAVLRYLFHAYSTDLQSVYRELIAIKPGFHEIWADDNWLEEGWGHIEGLKKTLNNDRRTLVLKELHRLIDPVPYLDLTNITYEISIPSFITYAPCSVAEGPFVYRRKPEISYYHALRNRTGINLNDYFLIFDYYDTEITEKVLEVLKCFQFHSCLD